MNGAWPHRVPRRVFAALYLPWGLVVWAWTAAFTVASFFVAFALWSVRKEWAYAYGRLWSWTLTAIDFVRVTMTGIDKARPGQAYVIVANHQSHFDTPCFWSRFPRPLRFVMKSELMRIPFLGHGARMLGMVAIDRGDKGRAMASLREARPLLDAGVSLMFFAEGTRSPDGRMGGFKKGAFVLAMEAGLPILPVSISGTHRILPGKKMTLLPGRARIAIHDPVETAGLGPDDLDALVAKVHGIVASGLTPWERGL